MLFQLEYLQLKSLAIIDVSINLARIVRSLVSGGFVGGTKGAYNSKFNRKCIVLSKFFIRCADWIVENLSFTNWIPSFSNIKIINVRKWWNLNSYVAVTNKATQNFLVWILGNGRIKLKTRWWRSKRKLNDWSVRWIIEKK